MGSGGHAGRAAASFGGRTRAADVGVGNDTRDLYAFLDVTGFAEFLYGRVARTVEEDLPREIADLNSYDKARDSILARIDMADSRVSLLIHVIRQNKGRLSRSKRDSQFPSLSDGEAAMIEAAMIEAAMIEAIVQSAHGLSALHA